MYLEQPNNNKMKYTEDHPLIDEILKEAGQRFPSSGYGQVELLNVAIEIIKKRIDEMWQETNYVIEGRGFYEDINEMLKEEDKKI